MKFKPKFYSMKKQLLVNLMMLLGVFFFSASQMNAQLWTESFEADGEGTAYTSSFTFNDGGADHFARTDGSDVFSDAPGYSGFDGTFFWAGEDLDDNGGDLDPSKTLTFAAIDVTGVTSLEFRGLFATGNPDDGWDDSDVLRVEYNMDLAGWTTLLEMTTDTPGSNGGMYYDTDGDGTGDLQMTTTFTEIAEVIPVTGTSLEIRVIATANSGGEELAFDNFRVFDVAGAVLGCTDPTADNYDPTATLDDGSCVISGCTDSAADNFDPNANNDDGSCVFSGCTDNTALNFDAQATIDDGTCVFTLPAIVINELHYNGNDGAGFPDSGVEFIEIYNNDVVTVDLSDYSFTGVTFAFPAMTMIAPGEYVVVAVDATNAIFTGATYQLFEWTTGGLSNNGELVELIEPVGGLVVDAVLYDEITPWPTDADGAGPTLELSDFTLDNNDPANWCAVTENGTPGMVNSCGTATVDGCTDPTALNYDPAATNDDGSCIFSLPNVVINELHYNPCTAQGGDTDFEFLELYNAEATSVDISGWSFANGIDYTFPAMTTIDAGEYIIVTVNELNYTGNGYDVYQWTSGGLTNSGETVTLVDGALNTVDEVAFQSDAPWPALNGGCASIEVIDNTADNNDPLNWQISFTENGTPGAMNSEAPASIEYTIQEIQGEVHTGEVATTTGVVTAIYAASNLFVIQDGTGPFSGVWVAATGTVDITLLAQGDEVDVTGLIVEAFDNTQIDATEVNILTSGNALPAAEILTTAAMNDEQWEGVLLSVLGPVDNPMINNFGEWSVNDGSGSAEIDDLGYDLMAALAPDPIPTGVTFNVVGPQRFSFGDYQLEPRDANDVVRYGCTDNTFPNYDPLAVVDDGSCANILGCTDPNATNYNPAATADDGSCIVEGCTDDTALNYDATATVDDGSCYFTEPLLVINEIHYNPCTAQGDDGDFEFVEIFNNDVAAVDISGFELVMGTTFIFPEGSSIAAGEYIIVATNAASYIGNGYQVFENASGFLTNGPNGDDTVQLFDGFANIIDAVDYDDAAPWPTTPDGGCPSLELIDVNTDNNDATNWQASFVDNGTPGAMNSTPPTGCTDETASNYDPAAIIDDGSCEFAGCTDPAATNFDPNATTDDGSCILPGCTYEDADNYDATATLDDGSCTFTLGSCTGDISPNNPDGSVGDGIVNAGDLLAFLGVFGTVCE